MRITDAAADIVASIEDPGRKATVLYLAEELAKFDGRQAITKQDALSAILAASEMFLPGRDE